nr:uncharacterized protein LOC127329496 [Lolium perenne]
MDCDELESCTSPSWEAHYRQQRKSTICGNLWYSSWDGGERPGGRRNWGGGELWTLVTRGSRCGAGAPWGSPQASALEVGDRGRGEGARRARRGAGDGAEGVEACRQGREIGEGPSAMGEGRRGPVGRAEIFQEAATPWEAGAAGGRRRALAWGGGAQRPEEVVVAGGQGRLAGGSPPGRGGGRMWQKWETSQIVHQRVLWVVGARFASCISSSTSQHFFSGYGCGDGRTGGRSGALWRPRFRRPRGGECASSFIAASFFIGAETESQGASRMMMSPPHLSKG